MLPSAASTTFDAAGAGAIWFGVLQPHIRNELVGLEQDKVRIYATAVAAQIDSEFRQAMTGLETIATLPDIRAMRAALLPSTLAQAGEPGISTAGNFSLTMGTPIHDGQGAIAGVLHGSLGLMDRNPKMYRAILRPAVPREWDVFLATRDRSPIARAARAVRGALDRPLRAAV